MEEMCSGSKRDTVRAAEQSMRVVSSRAANEKHDQGLNLGYHVSMTMLSSRGLIGLTQKTQFDKVELLYHMADCCVVETLDLEKVMLRLFTGIVWSKEGADTCTSGMTSILTSVSVMFNKSEATQTNDVHIAAFFRTHISTVRWLVASCLENTSDHIVLCGVGANGSGKSIAAIPTHLRHVPKQYPTPPTPCSNTLPPS